MKQSWIHGRSELWMGWDGRNVLAPLEKCQQRQVGDTLGDTAASRSARMLHFRRPPPTKYQSRLRCRSAPGSPRRPA
jgi:hypothetical protein